MGVLDAIGPWLGNISLVSVLFIALARGWLLTPAGVNAARESQEARIKESLEREKEWKQTAQESIKVLQLLSKQIEVSIETAESVLKIVEALQNGTKKEGQPNV